MNSEEQRRRYGGDLRKDRSIQCKREGESTETCWLIWNQEASGDLRSRFQMGGVTEQRAANPGAMEGVDVKTGYSWKEFE